MKNVSRRTMVIVMMVSYALAFCCLVILLTGGCATRPTPCYELLIDSTSDVVEPLPPEEIGDDYVLENPPFYAEDLDVSPLTPEEMFAITGEPEPVEVAPEPINIVVY